MSSVCIRLGFARPKQLIYSSPNYKPDFPSLPDEKAEPCPDMNIKVASFTVSKKYINMLSHRSIIMLIVD